MNLSIKSGPCSTYLQLFLQKYISVAHAEMDSALDAKSEPIDIASFTSDSAMMIAYERALESDRGEKESLFVDPYAKTLVRNVII